MVRVPESQRVRDALENAVVDGHYRPGERLDPAGVQPFEVGVRIGVRRGVRSGVRRGVRSSV